MNLTKSLSLALLLSGLTFAGCQNGDSNNTSTKAVAPAASSGTAKAAPMAVAQMPASSAKMDNGDQIAAIDGKAITWGELKQNGSFSNQLAKFETEQAQRRYQLTSAGVNRVIDERLIETEAKSQGKSVEAYLQANVNSKVSKPSDSDLEELFKRNRRRMKGSLEDNREKLIERFAQQEQATARKELLTGLRDKYKVEISLPYPELPRLPVTVDDDPSKGADDPVVTIVEFSEFQCPYCKRAIPTVDQVTEAYGKQVKLVFRDFPLAFHQYANKASEAAECADEQGKFWEMHDHLFENQRELAVDDLKDYADDLGLNTEQFNKCLDSGKYADEVAKDLADGKALGVTGTPTFFINGQMVAGALPFDTFKAIIDSEIARAGK